MTCLRRVAQTDIACALYCVVLLLVMAGWGGAQLAPSTHVDLQLVLAVDASGSVDETRFGLQKQGYATAFRNRQVLNAIRSGQTQAISVTMVQWTGPALQIQVVPWTRVGDEESAAALADAIAAAPRRLFSGGTSISGAIDYAMTLWRTSPYQGSRRVIDVSGDGAHNRGRSRRARARMPSWWNKSLKELWLATFNARAETVAEKPFFRSAFKHTRCLIAASGYYEWHTVGKEKQPYYFTRRDGQSITIAGLWSEWANPETDKPQTTCTMIITEPNKFVAGIHDRMPVILEEKQFDAWLDDSAVPTSLVKMLKPAGERVLACHPVSKQVNSSRTDGDDATLIEKVDL
jgi:putative SOS response-associated peptidase YedK